MDCWLILMLIALGGGGTADEGGDHAGWLGGAWEPWLLCVCVCMPVGGEEGDREIPEDEMTF